MSAKKKQEDDNNNNQPADTMQRFHDLTRKIIQVPKEEVDEIDPLVQRRKKRRQAKSKK